MSLVKGGGVLLNCPIICRPAPWSRKGGGPGGGVLFRGRKDFLLISSSRFFANPKRLHYHSCGFHVGAFLFDPTRDPIIKDALKEPVAFMGGMFAGLLRLDLNEDPLREWIARTAEAAGITEEEIETGGDILSEESPQQIEIE